VNHALTRTTRLYDRRRDEVSLDEVERIVIGRKDRRGILSTLQADKETTRVRAFHGVLPDGNYSLIWPTKCCAEPWVCVDYAACHHDALLAPEFLAAARVEPSNQGARPQGARPVPRMRSEGAGHRLDQCGGNHLAGKVSLGVGLDLMSSVSVPNQPPADPPSQMALSYAT
jgi:hypothetical protein